jgi:hypothetical protein
MAKRLEKTGLITLVDWQMGDGEHGSVWLVHYTGP